MKQNNFHTVVKDNVKVNIIMSDVRTLFSGIIPVKNMNLQPTQKEMIIIVIKK